MMQPLLLLFYDVFMSETGYSLEKKIEDGSCFFRELI